MSVVINYRDGSISEFENVSAAVAWIESELDNPVWAEQWDASGVNDDGRAMERLLVWE